MISKDLLPEKICLEDYGGDYKAYIDAIYEVFARDFIRHKTSFGLHKLSMKYHPAFQERAYTFYHMTHKGEIESEREPDLRRCECMPWARPTIENTEEWDLKFWRQTRQRSSNRVCIALETESETYFVILEVRESYAFALDCNFCLNTAINRRKSSRNLKSGNKGKAVKSILPMN